MSDAKATQHDVSDPERIKHRRNPDHHERNYQKHADHSAERKAHWPGAAATGVAIEAKLNRLLPVQCSDSLGGVAFIFYHLNTRKKLLPLRLVPLQPTSDNGSMSVTSGDFQSIPH